MVNISIDVTDLGGEARPGDKVVFWRPRMGGSATHAGRVISTAPVTVFLTDGKATVSDVEPGEMTVLLQCRGVESQGPVTVGVPDGGHTVTLRALLEAQFEYAPPIVSAVQEAASNASASEEAAIQAQIRSEAAADRADAKVDDAINNGANLIRNEVKQDADRAVSARQAATQSESNAAASEGAAAQSETNAKTSETNAKQSETNAGDYAAVATTAATEAVDAMEVASGAVASIGDSVSRASTSAENAAQYESSAATHAQNATEAAEKVGTAAELDAWARAAQEAADRVGTAEQVGTWASESSAAASRAEQAESSAASYADSASVSSQQSIQSATIASDAKTDAALSSSTAGEHADRAVAARQVAEESATNAMSSAGEAASILSETLAVVTHGDDPYYPRPEREHRIMWLGSVIPLYRKPGDLVPAVESEPAPWTPEMLDLVAWYDPAAGYESGTVSQVVDRGQRNLHMEVGGTGGISIDTTALNLPAFANNGTAFATSPPLPAGAWEHPVTAYMVASLATMPSVSTLFDNGPGPVSTRAAFWVNSGGRVAIMQGTKVQSDPYLVTANTPFLLAVTYTGGATTQAELNGTVVVGPTDAGSNTPGAIRLFANGAGAALSDAVIGDVIIARGVTPEQHADTVAWLQEKWGLV